MLRSALSALACALPAPVAEAHCDGPCGVYDPASARVAAEAVLCLQQHLRPLRGHQGRGSTEDQERTVATFPDLHDTFWKAAKLCSACKVNIDQAKAEELMAAVEKIHGMFWQSKGRSDAWVTAS